MSMRGHATMLNSSDLACMHCVARYGYYVFCKRSLVCAPAQPRTRPGYPQSRSDFFMFCTVISDFTETAFSFLFSFLCIVFLLPHHIRCYRYHVSSVQQREGMFFFLFLFLLRRPAVIELFYVMSSFLLYAVFLFPVPCFCSLYRASLRVRTSDSSTSTRTSCPSRVVDFCFRFTYDSLVLSVL